MSMDDVFRRMRDSARQQEYNALNPQTRVALGKTGGMGAPSGKEPKSGFGINLGTGAGGATAGGIAAKLKGQKPRDSVNLLRMGRALFKG
jgi:hypothetical protein